MIWLVLIGRQPQEFCFVSIWCFVHYGNGEFRETGKSAMRKWWLFKGIVNHHRLTLSV
jgi:hypothetical protein